MFDTLESDPPSMADAVDPAVLRAARLHGQVLAIGMADSEAGLIDQVTELERAKSAIAAQQARLTDELDQRRVACRQGGRDQRLPHPDAGLGTEIGLSRRESPHEGRKKLRLARALLHGLPQTLAALQGGELNERRAEIIAIETDGLPRALRHEVDAAVCDRDLSGLGDARLRDLVRREVLRRDQASWLERHERARARRRVTGRLLGDGMAQLSALLPAPEMAVILDSLGEAARTLRRGGDERSRTQIVADLFIQRLGGDLVRDPMAVKIKLIVGAGTLLGADDEPAHVLGVGPVPATLARRLARQAADHPGSTLQRIFGAPDTGDLVAMESSSSFFRHSLAELITTRDRRCRTPFCNAPIRHLDHVVSRSRGGRTSAVNGQGLCEACNYAKESPGWRHESAAVGGRAPEVRLTTPTGHRHRSRAPDLPGLGLLAWST